MELPNEDNERIRRMNDFVLVIIGYFLGIIVSFLLFRPIKSFNDGYDAAKKFYNNWNQAYDDGFYAGIKAMEEIAHDYTRRKNDGKVN